MERTTLDTAKLPFDTHTDDVKRRMAIEQQQHSDNERRAIEQDRTDQLASRLVSEHDYVAYANGKLHIKTRVTARQLADVLNSSVGAMVPNALDITREKGLMCIEGTIKDPRDASQLVTEIEKTRR